MVSAMAAVIQVILAVYSLRSQREAKYKIADSSDDKHEPHSLECTIQNTTSLRAVFKSSQTESNVIIRSDSKLIELQVRQVEAVTTLEPRQYRKTAMNCYAAGADGPSCWDTPDRMSRISEWAFIERLGHRDN
ncbi:MAG: hypothetical protein ACYTBZ_08305 [Planctomycetota bacterium]